MLQSLSIQNLATIESATIAFVAGLNVLTGETGAGKSILIGGLELALGERASADLIRAGAKRAVAEAVFASPLPDALGALLTDELELEWTEDEPLVLRRELSRTGGSRCFVCGQMVGVGDLRRVGQSLVDLHGQHEHQSLFEPAAPRRALDAFAGHAAKCKAYASAWETVSALRRRRKELDEAARNFEERLDYLNYQIEEIERIDPQPGELDELLELEKRLARAEDLARAAGEAYALLYEGEAEERPSILGQLSEVARRLAEVAEIETDFSATPDKVEEVKATLEDLAFAMRDYAERMQADPERLAATIERIEAIRKLIRKHGNKSGVRSPESGAEKGKGKNISSGEENLFGALAAMRDERDRMSRDDAERRTIGEQLERAEEKLQRAGESLSQGRRAAAGRMGKRIMDVLKQVHMEKARFEIPIEPLAEPGADGLDRIDFLLAANPGLPPAALRKVASGGELSRVMLAIKSVLAARDAIPTLVFDEVDSGISGHTARRLGALLEKLSGSHQVICITHHAPIAARAVAHASVRKATRKGKTFTEILEINGDERIEELAHMMGGEASVEAARELARQLMR